MLEKRVIHDSLALLTIQSETVGERGRDRDGEDVLILQTVVHSAYKAHP